MCGTLREGRTYTAADPNTIKMDRAFVSMCVRLYELPMCMCLFVLRDLQVW